jgi:Na+:H+ antiporter, NhaA family
MLRRLADYIFDNSLLLIGGAVAGLLWANLEPGTYEWLRSIRLPSVPGVHLHAEALQHGIGLQYLVNDVLMAFFFALAGKEVWEALLPGGSLREGRRAAMPIVCAVGGMVGPAAIYLGGATALGRFDELGQGWAIPCATDIAFSYIIARLIFGRHHPAVPFLLLLAIADDALGLLVLAVFYPAKPVEPLWLALPAMAVLLGLVLRRMPIKSFWWYILVPGTISWIGFAASGLHPALGLLPIIPTIPHGRAETHVRWGDVERYDTLHQFGASWRRPVEVILGLFGLMNAGVAITAIGGATCLVLSGLVIGKPLGIVLSGLLAARLVGLRLPEDLGKRQLVVIGCAAGVGFTVALFVATVAFEPGQVQDTAKMGALASGLAAGIAVCVAWLLGVRRTPS